MRRAVGAICVAIWTLIASGSAQANLIFCNESGQTLNVSVAWSENSDWKSRGWFVMKPQECKAAIQGNLKSRYYWYYADSVDGSLVWNGNGTENSGVFCVINDKFFFRDANRTDCEYEVFKRIDTGESLAYAMSLSETRTTPREAALECSGEISKGRDAFAKCWMRNIATTKQRAILDCYDKTYSYASFALCASKGSIDSEALELASCTSKYLNRGDNGMFARCLAKNRLSEEQAELFDCAARNRGNYGAMAACAGGGFLDEDQERILSCVEQNASSYKNMGLCVAGTRLNSEQSRIVNCVASNSGSYTQMAVCAVGNQLTPEQQVMVSCAISTGGQPYAMAGCVGTQLTANELQKCIDKGIGGDGCFGRNNTAVKFISNAWKDVTKGPGPSNDLLGRDGFVGRNLRNAERDLRRGPGRNHDLFGEDGFVRRNAPPPIELGRVGGHRVCIPWC
jgi:uncharacterized membrane protein